MTTDEVVGKVRVGIRRGEKVLRPKRMDEVLV